MPPFIEIKTEKAIQKGRNQLIIILTYVNGQREDMRNIKVQMISPDHKIVDLKLIHTSQGDYRTSCLTSLTGTHHLAVNVTSRDRLISQSSFSFQVQLLPPVSLPPATQLRQTATQQPQPQVQVPSNLPPFERWDPQLWVSREIHEYVVKKALEPGGTGFVLIGLNKFNNREVAIKIPKLGVGGESGLETLGEVMSEAGKLQELSRQSNYIVQLQGTHVDISLVEQMVNSNDRVLYLKTPPAIIMELMQGGDAKNLLADDSLTYSEKWNDIVCSVTYRMAQALETVHNAGYVHLDIKPGNILFNVKPPATGSEMLDQLKQGTLVPKLTDLGSAVRVGGKFTQFTSEYASAQQVLAWTGIGVASKDMDVYSLGATMYMMLAKMPVNSNELIRAIESIFEKRVSLMQDKDSRKAFGEQKVAIEQLKQVWKEFVPDLSMTDDRFKHVLEKMVNKDARQRPTANEVAESLRPLLP